MGAALLAFLVGACSADDDASAPGAAPAEPASEAIAPGCEVVYRGQTPGDFEIEADPQDPAKNLLLVTTGSSSAEDLPTPIPVLVTRLDGTTGAPMGPAVTVGQNYKGMPFYNGPEFVLDGARSAWASCSGGRRGFTGPSARAPGRTPAGRSSSSPRTGSPSRSSRRRS